MISVDHSLAGAVLLFFITNCYCVHWLHMLLSEMLYTNSWAGDGGICFELLQRSETDVVDRLINDHAVKACGSGCCICYCFQKLLLRCWSPLWWWWCCLPITALCSGTDVAVEMLISAVLVMVMFSTKAVVFRNWCCCWDVDHSCAGGVVSY